MLYAINHLFVCLFTEESTFPYQLVVVIAAPLLMLIVLVPLIVYAFRYCQRKKMSGLPNVEQVPIYGDDLRATQAGESTLQVSN